MITTNFKTATWMEDDGFISVINYFLLTFLINPEISSSLTDLSEGKFGYGSLVNLDVSPLFFLRQ
jgi:hypothetical protein